MGKFLDWLFMGQTEVEAEYELPEETQIQRADEVQLSPQVDDVLLQALIDGEQITREKALTLPAVSGAVDFISNSIASMPVKLYKVKDGKVEEQEKDTRVKMLNGDTGDTLDAFQMKKAMVEDYLLGKGGYCYIQRNRNEVTGLFYVEERYITILRAWHPIFKDYKILVVGDEYYPWDFIKLLRNTKDGASGIGVTNEVSKALETAYSTLLYQLNLVQGGGNKKGFLKSQRKLGQDEINVLKQAWRNLYSNSTENVVVLNNGLEFQEASNSSVENQINESKKTLMEEINDLFHITDDFDLTFKLAIYPIVKAFETALNRDLLLEKEKKNHFFEFDVKEIIRASLRERYEAYKLAKETGFMTLNEIRRAENMDYIEGLDVVNVGLGAVLYDTNTHQFYTPNTDTAAMLGTQKMLEGHVLADEFDASGNSSARAFEERYNDVHDSKTGRFGTKNGGSGGGSKGGSKSDSSGASGEGGVSGSGAKGVKDIGTEPVRPRKSDYDSDEALEAARAAYRKDREKFEAEKAALVDDIASKPSHGYDTKEKAQAWAEKRGVHILDDVFTSVDPKALDMVIDTNERLMAKYPEVLESYKADGGRYEINLGSDHAMDANGGVNLNPSIFRDYKTVVENSIDGYTRVSYNDDVGRDLTSSVRGDGTPRTAVTHEFGHNVEGALRKKIADEDYGRYQKELNELTRKHTTSEYSLFNSDEAFAEGFAEMECNPNSAYGKAFREFYDRWK